MTELARETGELKTPAGLEGMVERKIAEAYAAGLFDDLKDAGRPLDLRRNPFQDPAWRLAYHVLENAGMAPAWVEERRSIQEAHHKGTPRAAGPFLESKLEPKQDHPGCTRKSGRSTNALRA